MKKHPVSHRGIHVETYVSEAGQPVGPERALFADLRRRAEAGEAVAQNDLGGSYASGINGASRDSAAAFKWFARAAEQNLPMAVGNLGYCFQHGVGCPKDAARGLVLIRRAVEAGDLQSLAHLAYACLYGLGTEKDEAKAAELYLRAAERGYAHAMAALADMLRNGTGCARDDVSALEWVRKGASLGNATAMLILGDMYREGRGGVAHDPTTAANWYSNAGKLGLGSAQARMGMLLETGDGVPKDAVAAAQWYELAAANGEPEAIRRLAELRFCGIGVAKNVVKAAEDFLKAAEAGDIRAMVMLGNLAATGCGGVQYNPAKAFDWLRKAAEAGDPTAQFLVGEACENGEGVATDPSAAETWFRKAAEQGHKGAERALLTPRAPLSPVNLKQMPPQNREALLNARNGDTACMAWVAGQHIIGHGGFPLSNEEALRWCEPACDGHDPNAILLLSSFHATGTCVPRSLRTAIDILLPLAEAGNAQAQQHLADLYNQPDSPGRKPVLESVKWRACATGQNPTPEALNALGNAYFSLARRGAVHAGRSMGSSRLLKRLFRMFSGLPTALLSADETKHYNEALACYRKAAEKDYPQAFTNLADFAFEGLAGVPRDETEAFRLYSRASRLGDRHADVNLAVMLMEGWGCEKDEAKGRALLERSRAGGSAAARQLLCQVYPPATGAETLSVSEQRELMLAAVREFVYPAVERRLPGVLSKPLKTAASCLTVLLAPAALALVVFAVARWLGHLFASS